MTAKKCTKKRDVRAKLLFCLTNPLLLPLSLLKLPSDDGDGNDDDDDEEEEEEDSIILMCKILKSYWSNRYTLPLV